MNCRDRAIGAIDELRAPDRASIAGVRPAGRRTHPTCPHTEGGSQVGRSSKLTTLTFDDFNSPTGTLDLNQDKLVVDYTGSSPFANLWEAVDSAYGGGTWNGTGITSATAAANNDYAIAIGEASVLGRTSYGNLPVDSTAVLLGFTWGGDADMDGDVDDDDSDILLDHFGDPGTFYWTDGDFNYDNTVTLADYNILVKNYGQGGLGALAPEPSVAGALSIAAFAFGLARPRQRRRH